MEADVTTDPQSAVQRVADALRAIIKQLQPGDRLPSQSALTVRFDVSRDTVQRALRRLGEEGLITSTAGSGSFVAEALGDEEGDELLPAIDILDQCLEAALKEREVTVDFFGFTCETLATLLKPRLDKMRSTGAFRPDSLRVRALVPAVSTHLALPRTVDDPADPRPLERLREITTRSVGILESAMTDFRLRGLIPGALFEVRTVRMTPQVKLYIVNGDVALRGWYEVSEQLVELPVEGAAGATEEVLIYDLMGLEAPLIPQRPSSTATAQAWFDSVWSTIAVDWKDE
jgi:DNA-binding transcriptional regulator YhcF (GntR family)